MEVLGVPDSTVKYTDEWLSDKVSELFEEMCVLENVGDVQVGFHMLRATMGCRI